MKAKQYIFGGLLMLAAVVTTFAVEVATNLSSWSSTSVKAAFELPYTKSFQNDFNDWSTIDANGDGTTWKVADGGFGALIENTLGINDDYLVSPTFSFTEGHTYKVTLSKSIWGAPNSTDKFELCKGTGAVPANYSKVADISIDPSITTEEITFIATGGEYSLAIHSLCGAFNNWQFRSFKLESLGYIEPPKGPTLSGDFTTMTSIDPWTVIDANNDGVTWHLDESEPGITLSRATKGAQNDWLVSPGTPLEAGKIYLLTYEALANGGFSDETFTVNMGMAPTAAGLDRVLATESIATGVSITHSVRFSPTVTGDYYFGVHATSPSRNGAITLKSILITENEGVRPVAPINFEAVGNFKAKNVTLSWTNPNKDTDNIDIAGVVKTNIYRNDVLLYTISGAAGESMLFIDTPTPFEGQTTYRLEAFCEEGMNSISVEQTINLSDFQGEIKSLKKWGGKGNGDFQEWDIRNLNGGVTYQWNSWNNSYSINMNNVHRDLAVSPAVQLIKNRRYVIRMNIMTGLSYWGKFSIGISQYNHTDSIIAPAATIHNITAMGNGSMPYETPQFTVPENGTYYLSFYCTGAQTMAWVYDYEICYYDNAKEPGDLPYVEPFDNAAAVEDWTFETSNFAVNGGQLKSNMINSAEYFFTPEYKFRTGYIYEISVEHTGAEGMEMSVCGGASQVEYNDGVIAPLNFEGTQTIRYEPTVDGDYCVGFKATYGYHNLDNLKMGDRIYAPLTYSEKFTGYAINNKAFAWQGVTIVDAHDRLDVIAGKFTGVARTPWFEHTKLAEKLRLRFSVKKGSAPLTVKSVLANGTETVLETITETSTGWIDREYILENASTSAYGINFKFECAGETFIDDVTIDYADRYIKATAPVNFQVAYQESTGLDLIGWTTPSVDVDGNTITRPVRVNVYRNDELLGSVEGNPGEYKGLTISHLDCYENGVINYHAQSQVIDVLGEVAFAYNSQRNNEYTVEVANYNAVSNQWISSGNWTLTNSDKAFTSAGAGWLSTPQFTTSGGYRHLINYSLVGSASETITLKVKVLDAANGVVEEQTFTDYYAGYDRLGNMPTFSLYTSALAAGKYSVKIEVTSGNVSVGNITIAEIHDYASVLDVPYFEPFEDGAVKDGKVAPNWTIQMTNNATPWGFRSVTNAYEGTHALTAPSVATITREDIVYTPYIRLHADVTYTVEFWYNIEGANSNLSLVFAEYLTSTDFVNVQTLSGRTNGWKLFSIELPSTSNFECLFGFVAQAGAYSDGTIAIDNLHVYEKNNTTALESVAEELKAMVADNHIWVSSEANNVTVLDMQGRIVAQHSNCASVDISNLASGIYIAHITSKQGAITTLKFGK